MKDVLENIIRFFVLLPVQILLVNNLHLLGVCNPCIYLLFLMALPINLPPYIETLIGFLTGLVMDLFCNSLGAHMMACTAFSYMRPILLGHFVQQKERLIGSLHLSVLGWGTYAKLLASLVVLHHLILFSMEAFSWSLAGIVLLQVLISSIVTIGLIIGWEGISL